MKYDDKMSFYYTNNDNDCFMLFFCLVIFARDVISKFNSSNCESAHRISFWHWKAEIISRSISDISAIIYRALCV